MRILVSTETSPCAEFDLFDWLVANEVPPDTITEIVGDLHMTGQHIAQCDGAFITIEKV